MYVNKKSEKNNKQQTKQESGCGRHSHFDL